MHAQQQRLTQEFMERSALHASLWTALHEVVPHWNPRITRRFIQTLIPLWQADLMDEAAQLRYLQLAMRLGWFDEAASARKWTLFIELLRSLPSPPPMSTSLNLFNLIAALPQLPSSLQLNAFLDERLCDALRALVDASTIRECVAHVLSADYASQESASSQHIVAHARYFHHFENKSFSEQGKRWLAHPWRAHQLTPLALMEPFGKEPWLMVSNLGLDTADRLVAYDLPQDRHTIIATQTLASFEPQLRSSEPIWASDHTTIPSPDPNLLFDLILLPSPTKLAAAITITGAVALSQRS